MTQFIKLRGLPFSANSRDVLVFLEGLPLWDESGINITLNEDGRPSGEALVRLDSEVNTSDLMAYNGRYMGTRFIEIFPATQREFAYAEGKKSAAESTILRLRGLPFDVTKEDIYVFFNRLMIARDGVGILVGPDGIPTGEAFVQFMSKEEANMAQQRHNQCIRSRYIEIYKSSMMEAARTFERQYQVNREELMRQYGPPQQHPSMPYNSGMQPNNYLLEPYYQNDFPGPMRRSGGGSSAPFRGSAKGGKARAAPYPRGRKPFNSRLVFMRGLPYTANEKDIYDFFAPLIIMNAKILYGSDGKASGEAEAEFQSEEEAKEAMKRDRCKMSWRYIELFHGGSN